MKTINYGIIGAVALSFASAIHAPAIEGLQVSVQCSNVVLSWPSVEGETYIVQYRQTLATTDTWQTLTSSLPACTGTNVTSFVHSNIVQHPNCSGNGFFSAMAANRSMAISAPLLPAVPMAIPRNGSSAGVPACLYPPGFDFSGYVIVDPVSGESVNGSLFATARTLAPSDPLFDGPQPLDGGESGGSVPDPETGFYRVVRNGIHLIGITNGMTLSGTVSIPVEVGAESGNLVSMSVRECGSPVGNSAIVAPFDYPLHITLNTAAMSNGIHQISGFASWNSGGDEGSGDGMDAQGDTIGVNIQNEITFPNWIDYYGELYDALLITAESAHTDADWFIDIYGSESGYIGTFGGHTYDGHIYGWWDLVGPPPNYTVYNNERYFDFVVTTEWSGTQAAQGNGPQPQLPGGSSSATMRTYRQNDNWTSKGMWVVANLQAWEGVLGSDMLDTASDGFAQMAETFGLTVRPSRPAGESFRIGYGGGIPESTRNSQWASLRSAIYNQESRNFFYLGHGSPDGIGASTNINRFIKAAEVASMLHTIPAGQTNRHSYRFVFLFGCETASGTLPESFGIIHRENVPGIDYANAGLTPGAFVGWNHKQSAAILSSVFTDNAFYLQHFQLEWTLYGRGLNDALDHAKNDYTDVGFINRSKLKCFGNWDLRPLSFNR
jgi:hypothetical protein